MSVSFYGYNQTTQSFSEEEFNCSNLNASGLLDLLGIQVGEAFEERCCGSMSAEDFLGRVLMAQAIMPADEGLPVYKMTGSDYSGQSGLLGGLLSGLAQAEAEGVSGPTIWSGGRSAGYYDQKLVWARELADEVISLGDDWVINWA
jgi:hypothetical protein